MSTVVNDLLLAQKEQLELQLVIDEAALLIQEDRATVLRTAVDDARLAIVDIDAAIAALAEE